MIDKIKNMKNKETLEDYVLNSDEHNNLKSDDGTYLNFHRQSELLRFKTKESQRTLVVG